MNFVRNEIIDSFLLKLFFYIKCGLFHDVIVIVKSIIFKLKTININIYFLKLFYNLNFKRILNQTH
jgi:hypothetical protein